MPDPAPSRASGDVRSVAVAFGDPGSQPSGIVAVIPIRDLETAKSRLGEALDPEERQALALTLLDRTVAAARQARSIDRVLVISPDRELLSRCAAGGADVLRQRRPGLNAGLEEARDWAVAGGAAGILVLPADLPNVRADLVDAVVARGRDLALDHADAGGVVVLVPDGRGDGTNGLLLVPPDAISFEFGPGSRQRHGDRAREAGAAFAELEGPLSLDLDVPEDLLAAETEGLMGVEA